MILLMTLKSILLSMQIKRLFGTQSALALHLTLKFSQTLVENVIFISKLTRTPFKLPAMRIQNVIFISKFTIVST